MVVLAKRNDMFVVGLSQQEINTIVRPTIVLDGNSISVDDVYEVSPLLVKLANAKNIDTKIDNLVADLDDLSSRLTTIKNNLNA